MWTKISPKKYVHASPIFFLWAKINTTKKWEKKLLNMKWVRLKMIHTNGLGPLEACLLCGFKQAEFNFMTFVDFATSAPRQRVILRGICLCGEVHETYDIKSEVINVCDD